MFPLLKNLPVEFSSERLCTEMHSDTQVPLMCQDPLNINNPITVKKACDKFPSDSKICLFRNVYFHSNQYLNQELSKCNWGKAQSLGPSVAWLQNSHLLSSSGLVIPPGICHSSTALESITSKGTSSNPQEHRGHSMLVNTATPHICHLLLCCHPPWQSQSPFFVAHFQFAGCC